MKDRGMQALYLLALDPVAESTADPNSYGFRKGRSTADAIGQCYAVLARTRSPQWILEGDIKACFDRISHEWMSAHIPMDKTILWKWLKAGFIDENALHPTEAGTPQGGIMFSGGGQPHSRWSRKSASRAISPTEGRPISEG
jgi:RNA-directed DNA polymerase